MRQIRHRAPILGATLASLSLALPASAAQPEIDTSTQWTVEQQTFADGKASLVGIHKQVKASNGASESIPCFGEITVPGVVVNGQDAAFVRALGQERRETADATEYSGRYEARYGTQSVTIALSTQLFRDGKLKLSATAESAAALALSVPVFMNYDFHGPGHDVFEFAWNVSSSMNNGAGQVPDPLANRSPMTYGTSVSSMDTVDYFATVPNGLAVRYPGLHQGSNPASIEYTALARVYDAYAKLGMVLWPWSDAGEAGTNYTLIFQRKSDGARINPTADTSAALQQTVSYLSKLPRYAVDGVEDQAVTVVLEGSAGAGRSLQLAGKLFQKSSKRELQVNVHTWGNLLPWVPAGAPQPAEFVFDPDHEANGPDGRTTTFRRGLGQLVGDAGLVNIAVHRVDSTVAGDFGSALDKLRDFSTVAQEDVERWQTDLFILPGETNQQGIMPDILGGSNSIEREGAKLNWNAIRADAEKHATTDGLPEERWSVKWQQDRATVGGLHELGHTFGFTHDMALNQGANGQYTDLMNNTNDHFGSLFEFRFADKCLNWFRVVPEGWAKPGRYGTWFLPGYPNGDSTPVDPLYTPVAMVEAKLGDVDYHGVVDITDALRIARASTGLEVAGDYYSALADVNCDGQVTIVDALVVARYAVQLIPAPSCPSS
jgi:hypothetical protein